MFDIEVRTVELDPTVPYYPLYYVEPRFENKTIIIYEGAGPAFTKDYGAGYYSKIWPHPLLVSSVLVNHDGLAAIFIVSIGRQSTRRNWRFVRSDAYGYPFNISWSALSDREKQLITHAWLRADQHMLIVSPNRDCAVYL